MELANSIVNECVIPADWDVSSIVNSYKGKGDALERGNKSPKAVRTCNESV